MYPISSSAFRFTCPLTSTVFAVLLLAAPLPAQVVINEIMQDPAAVSYTNGEWFELLPLRSQPGSHAQSGGLTICPHKKPKSH